jgi:hypothetical protein
MKRLILITYIVVISSLSFCYELIIPQQPVGACFTDFNGDGYSDIIIGHITTGYANNPSLTVLTNDGFGRYSIADTTISFSGNQAYLMLHDINNDGISDLITQTGIMVEGELVRYLRVFYNFSIGNYAYSDYQLIRNSTLTKIVIMDLSNNEHVICFVSNAGFFWGYMKFNSSGTPSTPVFFDLTNPPGDMVFGDINNDQTEEICVKVYNALLVYQWSGTEFIETTYDMNNQGWFINIVDMNNDSFNELICYRSTNSTSITLYSFPDFSTLESTTVTPNLVNPHLSDLNNDGNLDIIYTSSLSNPFNINDSYHTWILYHNQNGFLTPVTLYTGGLSYISYSFDVNNDTYKDIVTLNSSMPYGYINILYNDGDGSFLLESPTPNSDQFQLSSDIQLSCYPNPFRNSVSITLHTKKHQYYLHTEIFNIRGQMIKSITSRGLDLHDNQVIWDGTDNTSKPVSKGLYYIKVKYGTGQYIIGKCIRL